MGLRSIQKPVKDKYRSDPSSSRITLTARGDQTDTPSSEQLAALKEKTELYCVVMQTLLKPPPIRTSWS